jgi:hypothetical protein
LIHSGPVFTIALKRASRSASSVSAVFESWMSMPKPIHFFYFAVGVLERIPWKCSDIFRLSALVTLLGFVAFTSVQCVSPDTLARSLSSGCNRVCHWSLNVCPVKQRIRTSGGSQKVVGPLRLWSIPIAESSQSTSGSRPTLADFFGDIEAAVCWSCVRKRLTAFH